MSTLSIGSTTVTLPSNITSNQLYTQLSQYLPFPFTICHASSRTLCSSSSVLGPFLSLFVNLGLPGGFGKKNLEQNFKTQAKRCTPLPSLFGRDLEGRRIVEVAKADSDDEAEDAKSKQDVQKEDKNASNVSPDHQQKSNELLSRIELARSQVTHSVWSSEPPPKKVKIPDFMDFFSDSSDTDHD
ncbi:hypothetical protein P9112_003975 [Eukaryota sp. TZLM1-RC]